MTKIKKYIIYNPKERLWWSNSHGWGDRLGATRYSSAQKSKISHIPGVKSKWVVA